MTTEYPPEDIYEVTWSGPYTYEELKEYEKVDPDFTNTLSLYAKYQDHPLYGRKVLTYIGKAIGQTVVKRLGQHDLDTETVYVATIYPFESWKASAANYKKRFLKQNYIRNGKDHVEIITGIEELLIYALWPAGNVRNRMAAKNSWGYRIFNTGYLGDLPPEVSGHYALENAPDPNGK
ncbi:hypothetical protein GCM10011309_23960 [Litorimonas cladophorae]|uniref:Uncharacterized protein n=1 Tax=Litorimonas cladophorae TaxID=1220491 RepID=A0A918KRH4_9PROT|nr:hypothetical protein [Litorimonas cladophorae]GGX73176.1 hypothetical protein GCM10011309_23960 [Litorimonas cladophorae]